MATSVIENLTDDLDGTSGNDVHTVNFFNPLTGEKLELEVSERNAKALNKAIAGLDNYINASRVVQAPKPASKPKPGAKSDLEKVRAWARENGYTVGDRGRIKAEILEAYDKAQVPVTEVSPETAASDALDSETQVVDNKPADEVKSTEYSDADILSMMAEVDAEKGNVELTDLLDKANETK